MTKNFFTYQRKQVVKKLDGNGNPIPVTIEVSPKPEDPSVPTEKRIVPGEFETEEITVTDGFNINNIIRFIGIHADRAIVVLNDGHEEIKKVQALINPAKPSSKNNIKEIKESQWLVSEIPLAGEDLKRFYEFIDKH